MKTLDNIVEKYLDYGQFFLPDYGRDNAVLREFKTGNPTLSVLHTHELIEILNEENGNWRRKYFVADLLYHYDEFDALLMSPMLQAAIDFQDPSFNRIFIRLCLRSFGSQKVCRWLLTKFEHATLRENIGILRLLYWLGTKRAGVTELRRVMLLAAETSSNPIELYYYKHILKITSDVFEDVPDDAHSLCEQIKGNQEYEHMLYVELGWTKPSD